MKKLLRILHPHSNDGLMYFLTIGIGALLGFISGGITWSCIGSMIGIMAGFLIESGVQKNSNPNKYKSRNRKS